MNIKELIEKKLRADELALKLNKSYNGKIIDFANALDLEAQELEDRLEKLKQIYDVYHGFSELGLSDRKEVGDAVCAYAIETAKEGADGYRVLDLLLNAALDGSERAIMEYARVLAYGLYGVASSVEEAVDWLQKYADSGNAEACYSITVLHFDFPDAVEAQIAYDYCQKAASLGFYPAIRRLSQPFDTRSYTEKLTAKAEKGDKRVYFELSKRQDLSECERNKYLKLALEVGDMSAEFDYAMELKKNGNVEEAKVYFEKAGENGCADAYMELAKLAVPNAGEPYYNYPKLDVTLLPMNYHEREFEYHSKASELGSTRAMVYMGIAYKQGYPVNRDYGTAFELFARAVDTGDDFSAPYYLAQCYETGLGVDADENVAVMYYTMSAEHGNIPAMLALARIYKEGLGSIEKDEQKSTRYLFMSGIGRD